MYHAPLIEPGTELVTIIETEKLRIRPMTVRDAVIDYEARTNSVTGVLDNIEISDRPTCVRWAP